MRMITRIVFHRSHSVLLRVRKRVPMVTSMGEEVVVQVSSSPGCPTRAVQLVQSTAIEWLVTTQARRAACSQMSGEAAVVTMMRPPMPTVMEEAMAATDGAPVLPR